uniref:Uncharacterized protein n=1 Tax=Glossina pallidipes TaxID=7398 RepID=A0A1B0AK12_GLOPL
MIMKKFSVSGLMTLKSIALVCIFLVISITISEGKRTVGGGSRKSSSSGYSTRRQPSTSVTKPSYSDNSHADQAKLSYPNYNSQPNRPASAPNQNSPPIGWNVPNQQGHAGPPPAYSSSNVAGGAKTNIYEQPPVYQKPNNAPPPPNYSQATGSHLGSGTYYHPQGNMPPGAMYYPSNPHMPSGGYAPGGHSYYPHGMPAGGSYYGAGQPLPAGATFIPAGSSLPAGATYYASPPQQSSSGPGFGTGLVAGALGGALLGHALTPTQTRVVEHAPASSDGSSGGDRIIIINNGQPVNATDLNGATVVNAAGQPTATVPQANAENPAPLAPMSPVAGEPVSPSAPGLEQNVTAAPAEQPAPGGIICVPMRINETDPNDSTKMVEVEKIACYPAPPPAAQTAPADGSAVNPAIPPPVEGSAPLAPLQQSPTQATLIAEQSNVQTASKGGTFQQNLLSLFATSLLSYAIAYIIN